MMVHGCNAPAALQAQHQALEKEVTARAAQVDAATAQLKAAREELRGALGPLHAIQYKQTALAKSKTDLRNERASNERYARLNSRRT